ncbi:hypothetical protein AB0K00_13930 [Dactylosporangium sp. NPDC049525]|uniref:hypothetical protein n=1 Tax=Dactylosporangium sp. NPDC049525 TaxID=3154730 RepID=UPI00341BE195
MNRTAAALAALAAGLLAAFVIAPPALVGDFTDERDLTEMFRGAFVEYWGTGGRNLTPGLQTLVDDWFRYHLVKAVTAALLLAVLVALGAVLWKTFQAATGRRRAAVASAGAAVTLLVLSALAVVMANIQGMAAPFASLLPMLVDGDPADPALAGTLDQVRQRLADAPSAPAAGVMVDAFGHYHAVMAVVAAVVAAGLLSVSVVSWRRFARTPSPDRPQRRAVASFAVLMLLAALAVTVVAVANTTVAADPVPALAALFDGSW